MSTSETSRLIDAVSDEKGEGRVRKARAELDAIRKAARVITAAESGQSYSETERADALALLARIASEAP